MIIGNGDLASVLSDREDRIYFASGVSNSQETRETEYQREIDLLASQKHWMHLVYFSSLSIYYSQGRYARHKKQMERLVKLYFPHYTIIRIGNITWGNNPYTIINSLRQKIKNNEPFEIRNEYRYIIDKDEFLYWVDMIPENFNTEMNITGQRMKVKDIVIKYCQPQVNADTTNNYGHLNIHSK